VPALLLALAGLAGLLAPPSLRALSRPAPADEAPAAGKPKPLNPRAGGRPPANRRS
jgi:hypothetical protein